MTSHSAQIYETPYWRFPLEVCEKVISCVAESGPWDTGDLYSCALVSSLWTPKSRLLLFQEVCLRSRTGGLKFMTSVSAFRRLGKYVVKMIIVPLQNDPNAWIYKMLQVLPPLLPNLRDLTYWNLPILHDLFYVLVPRFSNVTTLTFSNFENLSFRAVIRLVNRCKNIRTLNISHSGWSSPASFYTGRCGQLVKMHVTNGSGHKSPWTPCSDDVIRWLVASDPSLEVLRIDCDLPNQASQLEELFQKLSPTLRTLKLGIYELDLNKNASLCESFLSVCRFQTLMGDA